MKDKTPIALIVALCALSFSGVAQAQQNADDQKLNKEIYLEKDFVPVEKKATKKNELPKVKKSATAPAPTTLKYSDYASPTDVPTSIPTLMPYGYRTAHIFSDRRGYLTIGGGTQANFTGSFGYRILDEEPTKLGVWLQHNSTWLGKNSSKLPEQYEGVRNHQEYNDNTLGVDFSHRLKSGTISLGLLGHLDMYNYFGGWTKDWEDETQTYHDINLNAGWKSNLWVRDNSLNYRVGLDYTHSGWDNPLSDHYKHGINGHHLKFTLGGDYAFASGSEVGGSFIADYVNRSAKSRDVNYYPNLSDEYGLLTFSPYYKFSNERLSLLLGANINVSFNAGAVFNISPNVKLNLGIIDGVNLFATATGGKTITTMRNKHVLNRYDNPLTLYGKRRYVPFDLDGGLAIGPFQGLSAKVSFGYGITRNASNLAYFGDIMLYGLWRGMTTNFLRMHQRGYNIKAELNYRYRSLAEFHADFMYAPHDHVLAWNDTYLIGYDTGYDRAQTIGNFSLKVFPIRALTLEAGLHFRGGRYWLMVDNSNAEAYSYSFVKADNVIDLRLAGNYRLTRSIGLWAELSNLLNRRYDMVYGIGAQRLAAIGGITILF